MLSTIVQRVRAAAIRLRARVDAIVRAATRAAPLVEGLVRDSLRSREQLIAENMLLRQQLIVAARTTKRPQLVAHERGLTVLLARLMPRWREAVLLVRPETVLRWHRQGFRLFWRWKSKARSRKPKLPLETSALIRRMTEQNRLWGAERIVGELLKLGFRVAKRTVQRYMSGVRQRPPGGQTWSTFLGNPRHQIWACDFLQIYDLWFRPIFAFFIHRPRLAQGSPRRSHSRAELDVGGAADAQCDALRGRADHLLMLGEQHLFEVLVEYRRYFNEARTHQALAHLVPIGRSTAAAGNGAVIASPVLNGLHHDYRRAA